jgi:galactokinase
MMSFVVRLCFDAKSLTANRNIEQGMLNVQVVQPKHGYLISNASNAAHAAAPSPPGPSIPSPHAVTLPTNRVAATSRNRRMEELRQVFVEQYGPVEPTHVVTAPGRINLIGEHIDYNGLAVFPMALNRKVTMLFRARDDARVRVRNVNGRYAPLDFTISSPLEPYADGEWGNYVKAAVQELLVFFPDLVGFDAAIRSDIPMAAGLSSSSALVVATALALIQTNDVSVGRGELMDMLADAERYVGTKGGGMDQAICVGAVEGTAARIDFDPVRLSTTDVPGNWCFIVANSLVGAEKSGAARDGYNQRTLECKEALRLVVDRLGKIGEVDSYPKLLDEIPVENVMAAAHAVLPGLLDKRFKHVITEATRVAQAERAMARADAETFGRLMSESHTSLRDDFGVSGPELDELTELATAAGAAGARLTGAGFGGCIIALCTSDTVDDVISALEKHYYSKRGVANKLQDLLFVARPGGGAVVREVAPT